MVFLRLHPVAEYKNIEFTYTMRGRERGWWDKLSSFDWSDREDDDEETEVIGVDSSAVINSLRTSTSHEIKEGIEETFKEFSLTFDFMLLAITKIEKDIELFKTKIEVLKNDK